MDDPEIECPYNKSHVLLRSRMQTHLVKCKKANANPQQNVEPIILKSCMFNANHLLPPAELDEHQKNCPDIGVLVRHAIQVGEGRPIAYNPIALPKEDENWDEFPPSETYDAASNAASKHVVRILNGGNRSERKYFRLCERDRFSNFADNSKDEANEPSVPKPVQMSSVEKHAFTDEALRQPKGVSLAIRNSQLGQGRGVVTPHVNESGPNIVMPGVGRASSRPASAASMRHPGKQSDGSSDQSRPNTPGSPGKQSNGNGEQSRPNTPGSSGKRSDGNSDQSRPNTPGSPGKQADGNWELVRSKNPRTPASQRSKEEECLGAMASLKVENGKNEKKKKPPTSLNGHNGGLKLADFPDLPARGRGRVRK